MAYLRGFFSCVILIAVFCVSGMAGGSWAADKEQSFLIVEDPWPPYTYGKAGDLAEHGLVVELMDELFRRVDRKVRLELYPWKRCITMVKNGLADALMLTVKTQEREQFCYFPEHFFVNKILFYHRRGDKIEWNDFSDLKDYTIGIVAGAKYSQEFQDAISSVPLKTETVESIPMNFKKLKAGRIDLTPVLDVVAAQIIDSDKELTGVFATASKPLRITPMQMAVSRSSSMMNYIDTIDQTIKDMKIDGTVDRLYRKYVPVDNNPNQEGSQAGK